MSVNEMGIFDATSVAYARRCGDHRKHIARRDAAGGTEHGGNAKDESRMPDGPIFTAWGARRLDGVARRTGTRTRNKRRNRAFTRIARCLDERSCRHQSTGDALAQRSPVEASQTQATTIVTEQLWNRMRPGSLPRRDGIFDDTRSKLLFLLPSP
ncbi:hypothetical protein AAG906_030239 [Vitis piasezkii]